MGVCRALAAVAGPCVVLVLVGVILAFNIGSEFMPEMDESSLLVDVLLPPETSLEESSRIASRVAIRVSEIPEVQGVVRGTGKARGAEFDLEGGESGVLELRLSSPADDHLVVDDKAWTVVSPPRPVRVLLVTPGNEPLELALTTDSLEEIAERFGLSAVSTVHEHLANLGRKGFLRRGWNRARSIEPLAGGEVVEVPLAGTVAAGAPIEAVEIPEGVALPPELAGRGSAFALRVRGESMMGDGILDGDIIVVEKRKRVENGALAVVVLHGDEATVKRFYQDGDTVTLKPSNPSMEDMALPASEVEVRGVVTGLIRRYRRI